MKLKHFKNGHTPVLPASQDEAARFISDLWADCYWLFLTRELWRIAALTGWAAFGIYALWPASL